MSKLYKHFWLNKDCTRCQYPAKNTDYFCQESSPSISVEEAIKQYYQEDCGFPYYYTLVWDIEMGSCKAIDIREEIESITIEEERNAASEAEELRANIIYFRSMQVRGL
jgi:G:T-mismatch repair DNA endonuclease (very short patch repair protein)